MSSFNRRNKGDNYYQHDNRVGGGNFSGRHVSFKSGGMNNSKNRISRQRGLDTKLRKFVEDDVDMQSGNQRNKKMSNFRFNPMRGRIGRKFNDRTYLTESSSSWYQVTLCHGKKYNRQEVLKSLQSFIEPVPLLPISVKIVNDDMTFYVDNHKTAQSLNNANLKIQMRDGWKIQIKVVPNMPFVELTPELKEKMKQVMSSKFDAMSQHLDLSRFYANDEFLNNDLFVPLNRQNMLLAVFQIISESVPNLRSLNLSDNKIFSMEHFSMLRRDVSGLKSLDLSKNKIRDLSLLNCLQGLQLENLTLDLNPLCDKYQDQTTYVREVRKIFRMLLRLDGIVLPPPVHFDVEENARKLPTSHGSFLCSVDGRPFTRQFLEQFFALYDNQQSRDPVAEAYAENAQFSMTAFSVVSGFNLNRYILESRNLKKVPRFERRAEMLHHGRAEIVRFLNSLPKTQHDLTSFTVDLSVFTPNLISLSICGVFRETKVSQDVKAACIKAFTRTFVLVPAGSGFKIINDMLSITNPSEQMLEMAFQSPQPSTSVQSPNTSLNVTPAIPVQSPIPVASPQEEELNRKREMVTELSNRSGMNLMWSEKCLVETNWNFDTAFYAFTEFNKRGEIPAEAFIK